MNYLVFDSSWFSDTQLFLQNPTYPVPRNHMKTNWVHYSKLSDFAVIEYMGFGGMLCNRKHLQTRLEFQIPSTYNNREYFQTLSRDKRRKKTDSNIFLE